MAQFYGTLNGARGQASRAGNKVSGITGHVRGLDIGCESACRHGCDGTDMVEIGVSTGSNGNGRMLTLGTFQRSEGRECPVATSGPVAELITALEFMLGACDPTVEREDDEHFDYAEAYHACDAARAALAHFRR